jgi:hypothetical protein
MRNVTIAGTNVEVLVMNQMVYYKGRRIADCNRSMYISEDNVLSANEHTIKGMLISVQEMTGITVVVNEIVNSIVAAAKNQEDPKNRIIVECEIREAKGRNQVIITSNCDGWAEDKHKLLFSYYNDELSFSAHEFIGLTEQQGHDLFHKKDVAYLQS